MKISLPACLFIAFGAFAPGLAQAQSVAPQPHSLSVKVEPAGGGGTSEISEKTHDIASHNLGTVAYIKSNQTQTTKEDEGLAVTVRNFGPLPDTAQVEWYFVAQPEKPDAQKPIAEQQSIFDQGARSVTLAPGAQEIIPVSSKDIISKLERHTSSRMGNHGKIHNERRKAGEKEKGSVLSGWMVRVVAEGRVIDSAASNPALEVIAKDDARFNVLKAQ